MGPRGKMYYGMTKYTHMQNITKSTKTYQKCETYKSLSKYTKMHEMYQEQNISKCSKSYQKEQNVVT